MRCNSHITPVVVFMVTYLKSFAAAIVFIYHVSFWVFVLVH